MARLLLVAYLPSLLFLGHWDLRLDLPGGYYLGLAGPAHDHLDTRSSSTPGDHGSHCHGDLESCASIQAGGPVPVAVLSGAPLGPIPAARTIPAPLAAWQPAPPAELSPDTPPPRDHGAPVIS